MSESTMSSNPIRRYKSVALPAEHGGWGFLIEPMIAGLVVAPSWAGFWLCLAAFGVFLIHQPLRTVIKDRLKGRVYERTRWAEKFTLAYGGFALVTFLLAWSQAAAPFWLPLVVAGLMAGVQLAYERRNRGREFVPETFGALALGATASAVVLAAGGSIEMAALLWVLLALRVVPSLLYVRVRLRALRGLAVQTWQPLVLHVVSLVMVAALWLMGALSWMALAAPLILLARAAYGLRPTDAPVRARDVGIQEMVFGVLYAILIGLGAR